MVTFISHEALVRRARIAAWGFVAIGIAALALSVFVALNYLEPLIDDVVVIEDMGQVRGMFVRAFLPSVVVLGVTVWCLAVWRKQRAPVCPACKTAFLVFPKSSAETGRCYSCGEPLTDAAKPSDVTTGLERSEFVRRSQLLRKRFQRNTFLACIAPYPFAAFGICMGILFRPNEMELIPWFGGGWMVAASYVCFIATFGWAILDRKRQIRTLALVCPECGASLADAFPPVVTTGHCSKCKAGVVKL